MLNSSFVKYILCNRNQALCSLRKGSINCGKKNIRKYLKKKIHIMLKNRFSIHCIEVTKYFYFNSTEFQPKIKGIFLSNAVNFMELRYLGFSTSNKMRKRRKNNNNCPPWRCAGKRNYEKMREHQYISLLPHMEFSNIP